MEHAEYLIIRGFSFTDCIERVAPQFRVIATKVDGPDHILYCATEQYSDLARQFYNYGVAPDDIGAYLNASKVDECPILDMPVDDTIAQFIAPDIQSAKKRKMDPEFIAMQ